MFAEGGRCDGQGGRPGLARRRHHQTSAQLHQKGDTEQRLEDLNKVVEGGDGARPGRRQGERRLGAGRPQREPLPVIVDKMQIQQVVFNLVRNSVEAMTEQPAAAPSPGLDRADGIGTDGTMAEVAVSDTGPGLAPKVQAQLFQPFITTKEKGMGLGLSICRSIIDAHGGRLRATPNAERGVTFQFTLPLADQDGHDATADDAGLYRRRRRGGARFACRCCSNRPVIRSEAFELAAAALASCRARRRPAFSPMSACRRWTASSSRRS